MENTRSYVSRFSGLGLFLLALLVVSVLVWLTIRSASDDNNNQAANNTADTEQTAGDNQVAGNDQAQSGEADGDDETAGSTANSDDNLAADDDESGSTLGVNGEVVNGGNLPNTGPESVLISAVGLMALAGAATAYRRSANDLRQAQL